MFIAVKENISGNKWQAQQSSEVQSNELDLSIMLITWEDIVAKLAESDKVYNTLLKTRYALENNLINEGK